MSAAQQKKPFLVALGSRMDKSMPARARLATRYEEARIVVMKAALLAQTTDVISTEDLVLLARQQIARPDGKTEFAVKHFHKTLETGSTVVAGADQPHEQFVPLPNLVLPSELQRKRILLNNP